MLFLMMGQGDGFDARVLLWAGVAWLGVRAGRGRQAGRTPAVYPDLKKFYPEPFDKCYKHASTSPSLLTNGLTRSRCPKRHRSMAAHELLVAIVAPLQVILCLPYLILCSLSCAIGGLSALFTEPLLLLLEVVLRIHR
jgi:hypothetical protein